MKILTHFMQTVFADYGDKLRVQYLDDKSGIFITAFVDDCVNSNAVCDIEKIRTLAKKGFNYKEGRDGNYEFGCVVLTIDKIKELAKQCNLFYGWTAIQNDLDSNAAFLYNAETHGVSIDLEFPFSDFELFQMMHKVGLKRFTLTGGLASTLASNMANLLNHLREKKVNDVEGMNEVMEFAKNNPDSRSANILRDNRGFFSQELQRRLDESGAQPLLLQSQPSSDSSSWFGYLGFKSS